MTKCIQFPISMSMPWIMTEFLINSSTMKEVGIGPSDSSPGLTLARFSCPDSRLVLFDLSCATLCPAR